MPHNKRGDAPSSRNAPSGVSGKLASKPGQGNEIPSPSQGLVGEAFDATASALHIAERALHHGGRKGMLLLQIAGYQASAALAATASVGRVVQ